MNFHKKDKNIVVNFLVEAYFRKNFVANSMNIYWGHLFTMLKLIIWVNPWLMKEGAFRGREEKSGVEMWLDGITFGKEKANLVGSSFLYIWSAIYVSLSHKLLSKT